jgi:hypothetical protein
LLPRPVGLHCLGGFVAAMRHGLARPTNDLDYVEIVPRESLQVLQQIAGPGSMLARKHGLHFQHVGVASLPESYDERLAELFPGRFGNLRLFTLDPHDLALSKLARNSPVDRYDVAHLAKTVPLNPDLLRNRYQEELRPILIGDLERHDRTLEMWIQAYFPRRPLPPA